LYVPSVPTSGPTFIPPPVNLQLLVALTPSQWRVLVPPLGTHTGFAVNFNLSRVEVKRAPTVLFLFIVTVQVPLPVQSPVQLENRYPGFAVATGVTTLPCGYVPAPVTLPDPGGMTVTVSIYSGAGGRGGGGGVASTFTLATPSAPMFPLATRSLAVFVPVVEYVQVNTPVEELNPVRVPPLPHVALGKELVPVAVPETPGVNLNVSPVLPLFLSGVRVRERVGAGGGGGEAGLLNVAVTVTEGDLSRISK